MQLRSLKQCPRASPTTCRSSILREMSSGWSRKRASHARRRGHSGDSGLARLGATLKTQTWRFMRKLSVWNCTRNRASWTPSTQVLACKSLVQIYCRGEKGQPPCHARGNQFPYLCLVITVHHFEDCYSKTQRSPAVNARVLAPPEPAGGA